MSVQSAHGSFLSGSAQAGFFYGVSLVSLAEPEGVDAVLEEAGFLQPARLQQVHGDRIVEFATARKAATAADALHLRAGQAGVIRVADCVPVILLDRAQKEAAVVHAGWKGSYARIVEHSLRRLGNPRDVHAYIGPAIGGCCYEVDTALAEKFVNAFGEGPWVLPAGVEGRKKPHIDLRQLNRYLLLRAGVESIEVEDACTFERPDLHSFRRDGVRAGRLGAFVGVAE